MAGSILGSLLLEIVTKANTSGLSKTDSSIKKMGRTLRQTSKSASLLSNLSGKLFGGFSFNVLRSTFNSYLQFEKDLGAMHSRFFAITHDNKKAEEEFDWVRKLATETAMDIKSTADSYSIFSSAVQKSLGQQGARQVFEDWSKVGRVLHLSEYQMERVTYALREMASKGTIYSQDLRMQIGTHVPNAMGLAQKAAEELGITGKDWFDKLQKASKGNAELTTKFVQLFSRNAREMFGDEQAFKEAMEKPDALAGQIKNFGYNFMVEFSKAGGSYMIVKILNATLEFLKSIDFYFITSVLGKIAEFIGTISDVISTYIPTIVKILEYILISVAIFKGMKVLIGLFRGIGVFFDSMKVLGGFGSFLPRVLYALELGFPKIAKLTGFLLRGGIKTALKGALAGVLGLSGPLGWIVGILTFLPEIISLVKWIARRLGMKDNSSNTIGDTGITRDKALEIARDLSTKGISSEAQLKQALGMYGQDALKLQPFINIDDKNDIKIYVNGEEIGLSKVEESKKTEVKQEKAGSLFNRPKIGDVNYNYWK